ncbi:MAG: hypothetical protein GY869_06540 [Planctomycetes bacterium]|nr:hypothetical protein [Planctomycetota bacterium]
MKHLVKLSMLLCVGLLFSLLVASPVLGQGKVNVFADPVRVMAGNEPMGKGMIYPSPVLYDIDGDKQVELVVGDLFGYIHVGKKLAGDDPIAWSELKKLQSAEGKDIKFSNW